MKKYKLLKEIPGCKIGDTIYVNEEDGKGSFVHAAGTGYVLPIKVLEDYKEYFEEICEWPKNWEDLKLKSNGFNNGGQIIEQLGVHKMHPSYKSITARLKLEEIAKAMNGDDWKPRLGVKKFVVVYHNLKKLHTTYTENISELISFKTRQMAVFSLNHHRELWEDYWMINK